ncbi:hypothetical protein ACP4OV_025975 [Aristida adscensionis]
MAATNPSGGNGGGNRPAFGEGRVHGGEEVPRMAMAPPPLQLERQPPIASILPLLGLSALVPDRASSSRSLAVARATRKRRRHGPRAHGRHATRARSLNQQMAWLGLEEAGTARRAEAHALALITAEAHALALITAEVGNMSMRCEASAAAVDDLGVSMDVAAPWPRPPVENDDGTIAPPSSPANSDASM